MNMEVWELVMVEWEFKLSGVMRLVGVRVVMEIVDVMVIENVVMVE